MAEERKKSGRHSVTIEDRQKVVLTGVTDVLSFDEEGVIADTEQGMILLKGTGLHVGRLNLDDGQVCVDGYIDSVEYSDSQFIKNKNSFLGKLFK